MKELMDLLKGMGGALGGKGGPDLSSPDMQQHAVKLWQHLDSLADSGEAEVFACF